MFHPEGLFILGNWGDWLVTLGAESLMLPPEFYWGWVGIVFWF